MAYTSEAKIKGMLKAISITASTTPSTSDVATFIEEEEAEINARLSEMYVVPITGAESLKIVSKIATYKVSQRIKAILEVNTGEADKDKDKFSSWAEMAEKMLKDTLPTYNSESGKTLRVRPILPLPDAAINNGVQGVSNSVIQTSGSKVGAAQDTFVKGVDSW